MSRGRARKFKAPGLTVIILFYDQYYRALQAPIRPLVRGILFCMGFHWVKVKGKLASPAEAPVLAAAPHSSFIDLLAIWVLCTPSGVSRKENEAIPLVGGKLNACTALYVSFTWD